MTNIVHEVWKILDNDPSIRREMNRGLINTSALARYIINEKKVDATLDAVISAIRRYKLDSHDDVFDTAYKLLGQTVNLSTKSNLAEISLIKDDEVQQFLPKLFSIIKYIRGDVLRVTQANESIRLLIDEKNMEDVTALFPKNKIITTEMNLAEINIYIHPKMQTTPGILAAIANELATNGINVVEFMTCPPEMLCVVKKGDLVRASNVLYQLCQPNKK
jgi:aspartokinase